MAETTKLFQTVAEELKAEISKLQQENEALRTKQEQFEKEKAQVPVHSSDPLTGPGHKRDMATQCGELRFCYPGHGFGPAWLGLAQASLA